jgi:hypothetical protein
MKIQFRKPAYGASSEDRRVNIYAQNWNVLRILSGMARAYNLVTRAAVVKLRVITGSIAARDVL